MGPFSFNFEGCFFNLALESKTNYPALSRCGESLAFITQSAGWPREIHCLHTVRLGSANKQPLVSLIFMSEGET